MTTPPPEIKDDCCWNCKFSRDWGDWSDPQLATAHAQCRRWPPSRLVEEDSKIDDEFWTWPIIEHTGWCGEYMRTAEAVPSLKKMRREWPK